MNVLWLTSWYPSKASMLSGDFIERHAQASALVNHTYVIHVVKDNTGSIKKATREEKKYPEKQLTAVIYYYPSFKHLGGFIDSILSNIYFLRLHKKAYQEYKRVHGKPAGILVQVGIKAGIIALLRKRFSGIPYILFERWTGFLQNAEPNFKQQPFLLRSLWRSVLKNARELVTASKFFGEYFKKNFGARSYSVVPNYINSELFYFIDKAGGPHFNFIHISTLDYQKNFDLLLEAFKLVIQQDSSNRLTVYGPVLKELQEKTAALGLSEHVIFKGEVLHQGIAAALQDSHALVLCSRYETFGNVVMEANAVGVPVIVSDLPIFHEIVTGGENGVFVPVDDVNMLAEKMVWMKRNIHQFNGKRIAAAAHERFSKEKIAAQFDALYKKHFN
jgi:glycosyltransferase involved in cell wall biosynthesis